MQLDHTTQTGSDYRVNSVTATSKDGYELRFYKIEYVVASNWPLYTLTSLAVALVTRMRMRKVYADHDGGVFLKSKMYSLGSATLYTILTSLYHCFTSVCVICEVKRLGACQNHVILPYLTMCGGGSAHHHDHHVVFHSLV